VGKTTRFEHERRAFYDPDELARAVRDRLTRAAELSERVDYLTFVPDGEPTLDVNLGKEIDLLKSFGIPVAVITNSSLLWREDVREELLKADWVSLKVDAVQQITWEMINRPHRSLRLSLILEGMMAFAKAYHGTLVTETMLVVRVNDNCYCMNDTADILHRLNPSIAYISTPTRPPADKWVQPADEESLIRVYDILSRRLPQVELLTGYEGDSFASTGQIENDILSIAAVHPMREDAVRALLDRVGSPWNLVEQMVARRELTRTDYEGHTFYLTNFHREAL
jgi:wyosine [tRNA(Phe)-imidazoG37] synthetase (radical SAM superfamily)